MPTNTTPAFAARPNAATVLPRKVSVVHVPPRSVVFWRTPSIPPVAYIVPPSNATRWPAGPSVLDHDAPPSALLNRLFCTLAQTTDGRVGSTATLSTVDGANEGTVDDRHVTPPSVVFFTCDAARPTYAIDALVGSTASDSAPADASTVVHVLPLSVLLTTSPPPRITYSVDGFDAASATFATTGSTTVQLAPASVLRARKGVLVPLLATANSVDGVIGLIAMSLAGPEKTRDHVAPPSVDFSTPASGDAS